MGNLGIFLFIFIGILVIAGWATAEMISSKTTRANKKFSARAAQLEKENDNLTKTAAKEAERYQHLKSEYDKAKEARDQIKEFEREYKKLLSAYNQFSNSINSLRDVVSAKKYQSNILSREVTNHLDAYCPSEEKMKLVKAETTQAAFKRIKKRMENS